MALSRFPALLGRGHSFYFQRGICFPQDAPKKTKDSTCSAELSQALAVIEDLIKSCELAVDLAAVSGCPVRFLVTVGRFHVKGRRRITEIGDTTTVRLGTGHGAETVSLPGHLPKHCSTPGGDQGPGDLSVRLTHALTNQKPRSCHLDRGQSLTEQFTF